MTLLLKDAILPNLVQTLEGGPALVHCGPVRQHRPRLQLARRRPSSALSLGEIVLTEAGFGADLGAEKFFDIKCRFGGLKPEAAVVVATVRALKMHGGVKKDALGNAGRRRRSSAGMVNLEAHVKNVQKFGVPVVVALNRFTSDTRGGARRRCSTRRKGWGARAALSDVWAKGGEGGEAVAHGDPGRARREEGRLQAALRRRPADQGEDRDHRAGDLRRRRRGLQRRRRRRTSRSARPWAWATRRSAWPRPSTRSQRRSHQAGPAHRLPDHHPGRLSLRRRRLRRRARGRHHDHAGPAARRPPPRPSGSMPDGTIEGLF